jgi:hypothetical protein
MDMHLQTLAAACAVTGSTKLVDYAFDSKGGERTMWKAIENLELEAKAEGKAEGKVEGKVEERKDSIRNIVSIMRNYKIPDEKIIMDIQDKYQMSPSEVQEMLA